MNQDTIHINEYAIRLLTNKSYLTSEYNKFKKNFYIIQNVEGNINPDILNRVIHYAKRKRKLKKILTNMLCYTDRNSISDDNFKLLICFSRKYRGTYLDAISHINLAFCQMQIINRLSPSYMAFAWLFDQICKNDCFLDEDMRCLLNETRDITVYGIQDCIDRAVERFGESSKTKFAQGWVNRLKGDSSRTGDGSKPLKK